MSNITNLFSNPNKKLGPNPVEGGKALLHEGLKHAKQLVCPACGCPYFRQATTIRRVSGLFTPTGQDALALNDKNMVCMACLKRLEISDVSDETPDDAPKEG